MDVTTTNRVCKGHYFNDDKKLLKFFIPEYEVVIGACLEYRNHWVLLMFEEKSSTITYVNPKGEKSSTISLLERGWNQFSSYQFLSEKSKKLYKWKVVTKSHFKQRDTSSCGVFVMRFAESLLLNEALPEEMKQIYELRQGMAEKLIELSDSVHTVMLVDGKMEVFGSSATNVTGGTIYHV
ncbi:uncharacterized protein [Dysidea avara]|uniref:uncharacterized protein n=1 Tax=Dysidea avara TaxID=196820 RepID=UPI00332CCFAC